MSPTKLARNAAQRLQQQHDYIRTLEQRSTFVTRHLDPIAEAPAALLVPTRALPGAEPPSLAPNRNLVFNGDFRVWPGIRRNLPARRAELLCLR